MVDLAAVAAGYTVAGPAPGVLWLGAPLWIGSFAVHGLYDRGRVSLPFEEGRRLFHGVAVATVLTLLVGWTQHVDVHRSWLAEICIVGMTGAAIGRILVRKAFKILYARGMFRSRVLIVGVNDEAAVISRTLLRQKWLGCEPVGLISTGEEPVIGLMLPVVGSVADLSDAVRTASADMVILASTALDPGALPDLYGTLQTLNVEVRVSAGLPQVAASRVSVQPLDGLAMLAVKQSQLLTRQRLTKRVVDVVGSIVLLTLAAPLCAVVAVLVRLTSAGPAIFRQVRVGEGGKPFVIYKFRSMVVDAESRRRTIIDLNEADGILFKMRADPRVTRLGSVLRRLGLDELPQLWNVLRGDMSLVGPRPPLPDETARYDEWVNGRLRVKPGITGLWQVSGRHQLSFADYVRYDLFYIENWSLFLDACIFARTLPVLLYRGGAA